MPTIRWSNGQEDKAPTWEELLTLVRKTQWTVVPDDEFRACLVARAYRWTRTKIDGAADADELFRQLQDAKLIEIITTD